MEVSYFSKNNHIFKKNQALSMSQSKTGLLRKE